MRSFITSIHWCFILTHPHFLLPFTVYPSCFLLTSFLRAQLVPASTYTLYFLVSQFSKAFSPCSHDLLSTVVTYNHCSVDDISLLNFDSTYERRHMVFISMVRSPADVHGRVVSLNQAVSTTSAFWGTFTLISTVAVHAYSSTSSELAFLIHNISTSLCHYCFHWR